MPPKDPVLASLAELKRTVDHLSAQVAAQEKRLHLVYTIVVLAVGIVGGPNAAQVLAGN